MVATTVGTSGSARGDRGFAAGLINTATQLGTAVSVALLVPLATAADDAVVGLRVAFAVTAAIAAAGGATVLALLRRRDG